MSRTGAKAAIPMYVDIVHTVNRRPRLVFDAKYKAESPSGRYPNADHYQMLAYCTALDGKLRTCPRVFPSESGHLISRPCRVVSKRMSTCRHSAQKKIHS